MPYRAGEILNMPDEQAERLINRIQPIAKEISEEKAIKMWEKEIKESLKLQDIPVGVHVEFLIDHLPYYKGEQVWIEEAMVKGLVFKEIAKVLYSNTKK